MPFRFGGDAVHVYLTINSYNLPEPDALIGATRGWLPDTIDRRNAARPGRGVGGGRPRKHPEE